MLAQPLCVVQLLVLAFVREVPAVQLFNNDRVSIKDRFAKFVTKYERSYKPGSEEYNQRLKIFVQRNMHIDQVNMDSTTTWTAGVNSLADRTQEERAQLLGWRGLASSKSSGRPSMQFSRLNLKELPDEKNWNDLFNMNFIRDQGPCGSCWALTASTVLAAHSEIYATNRTFSTQDLVECVPNPRKCGGTGGCEGATVELAFQFVATLGSREPSDNPYSGMNMLGCENKLEKSEINQIATFQDSGYHAAGPKALAFGMQGWQKLPENKYEPLMRAVAETGPVAVSLAVNDNFMAYDSGVFSSSACDFVLNHAVTLIGYGAQKSQGYWLVQNSWGSDWGETGKIKIERLPDEGTHCGTDEQPEMGTGCDGGPSTVQVCGTCGILYDSVVPIFKKK